MQLLAFLRLKGNGLVEHLPTPIEFNDIVRNSPPVHA
jgi:hypothetical protein